jgi:hypothetical protein
MSLTSSLYRAARLSADARAVKRGRVPRRVKNKMVGRSLARAGVWRFLWK